MPDLATELELINDLLDIGAIAIEIILYIGQEYLLVVSCVVEYPLQGPSTRIVEYISSCLRKPILIKLRKLGFIALEGYFFHDGFLSGLQQSIQPAQDNHGEDDIPVLASHIDIPEAVVGDGPDEGDEFVVGGGVHGLLSIEGYL